MGLIITSHNYKCYDGGKKTLSARSKTAGLSFVVLPLRDVMHGEWCSTAVILCLANNYHTQFYSEI